MKRLVLLCFLLGSISWVAEVQAQTPNDSIPQEVKRERKTAIGHRRKGRLTEVPDSALMKQVAQRSDSLAKDSLKGDTLKERIRVKDLLADSLLTDSTRLGAYADSLLNRALVPAPSGHFRPDPIRSMWLALVFPGGGQIYNRKYWKLPIVYGGFLGCTYALTWNNMMLHDYQQAYLDIMDSDPGTQSYMKMLPIGYDISGKEERFKTIFKNKKNHFRRFRDLSIFAFAGVYLISVIDAYVDAELSSFDINEDLSLRLEPAVIDTGLPGNRYHSTSYGLGCVLAF
ncbi:MAG: hypothetical protein IJR87_12095 [Bacteroidaceae bacterium]|nr:hypothetical protein [Bacteroidaceae bacterium]